MQASDNELDELKAVEGLGTALKTTGELDPVVARYVSRMGRLVGLSVGDTDGFESGEAAAARKFDEFAEEHWHVFEDDEEGKEEQSHEAYAIFTQWSEMFEKETEDFLEEEKTDASEFYELVRAFSNATHSVECYYDHQRRLVFLTTL